MESIDSYRIGRHAINGELEIFMEVGVGDVDLSIMVEGLDKRVVEREDKVVEELINEFKVVRKGKAEKWKKYREGENFGEGIRELALVKWIGFGEVAHMKLLICSSLHFRTKNGHPFVQYHEHTNEPLQKKRGLGVQEVMRVSEMKRFDLNI